MGKKKKARRSMLQRVMRDISEMTIRSAKPLADEEIAQLSEKIASRISYAAKLVSRNQFDLDSKLSLLCQRLREHIDHDDSDAVLTALLAESVRDDFHRLRYVDVSRLKSATRTN